MSDAFSIGARYLHSARVDLEGEATFEQVSTGITFPAGNPLSLPGNAAGLPEGAAVPLDALLAAQFAEGGQLVVIGQGEARFEDGLRGLGRRHPEAVGVHVGFEEAQARRMFAGSDFLLMPSRFEPCGLAQMYAQRFGSLPIVRRTGRARNRSGK